MPSIVTAAFATSGEAEAARARLLGLGVQPERITLEKGGGTGEVGLFDKLGAFLAPDHFARPAAYQLTAEVDEPQFKAAAAALDPLAAAASGAGEPPLTGATYEFVETAEELVFEKRLVVREEVVVAKEVEERMEDVHATVRRTEVEVERFGADEPRQE